jgi:hypothetical protein
MEINSHLKGGRSRIGISNATSGKNSSMGKIVSDLKCTYLMIKYMGFYSGFEPESEIHLHYQLC